MNLRKTILNIFLLFWCSWGSAQVVFIKKGKIEFERKTNTHRLYFSGEADNWTEQFKKLVPQFRTEYFDLIFDENKSLYQPGREVDVQKTGFFENPALSNVVFKDFLKHAAVSQKQVFETQFLVSDSLKRFTWKLEPETRMIAGFECRKAVTKICDSVVVVAFYSEEVVLSSGPESFSGLPGMILGIAIPRLYTTWFATKIETITAADEKLITPPAKGKKSNLSEMTNTIDQAIKSWGEKYHDRAIWFVRL